MATPDIRKTIDDAIRQEAASGRLRSQITNKLTQLNDKLVLPTRDPVAALMTFITGYIESVPNSISLVTSVSKKLGFFGYAAPLLHLAEDYFLQPPEVIADQRGLGGLLDEAFLAHRLLEEVNDHHVRHLQRPLLPIDMTEANIIVHHLIGDALASRLEDLVQFTAAQLLAREISWVALREEQLPEEELAQGAQLAWKPEQIRLRLAS